MPCMSSDGMSEAGWSRSDIERIVAQEMSKKAPKPPPNDVSGVEAILCGVLKAHGVDLFTAVDWAEVGIPEAVARAWWVKHQAFDALRKADEELQAAIKAEPPRPSP